ncbi:MAG: response regulator transcription factor [Cryobacterium sp.]|nr:response regulator transcription factor [Oligoflexia bacterium]
MIQNDVPSPSFDTALLVEDEKALAQTLKIALARLDIRNVLHATTLESARKILAENTIDLILLDRNLPDGDGLSLCRELRAAGFRGTVLCLTAKGEIDDRVSGLDAGADDYLPKPFHWEELAARIRALARRKSEVPKTNALWKCEAEKLRILGPKGWVQLTPLEFKLATHLMHANGGIVGREELLKEVWGFRFLPKTRTTDYFLGRLRKLFENNPDSPKHFITVRGAGYRFFSGEDDVSGGLESDPRD